MSDFSVHPLGLAARRYTRDPIYSADGCMVCGLHSVHTDCPHTADSLTYEQICRWFADGGGLDIALDASHRLRIRFRDLRICGVHEPTAENAERARQRIAGELNER